MSRTTTDSPDSSQLSELETALEREFYRYYQPEPFTAAETSLRPDLSNFHLSSCESGGRGHGGPRSSYDTALAAFAQLGALRLNVRRCMISFFDRKNQYILAEATRTLSLQTDTAQQEGDELWMGATVIPRQQGVCELTVALPMKCQEVSPGKIRDVTVAVIPDLKQDPRLKGRTYVDGIPTQCFYAGVPIRSPSGANIGSYCVLDDTPRDDIDPSALEFMKDMAVTVMMHLEMAKAKEDHRRGGVMVRGLGSFIEGRSSLKDWWLSSPDLTQKTWESPDHEGSSEKGLDLARRRESNGMKADPHDNAPYSTLNKQPSDDSVVSVATPSIRQEGVFSSADVSAAVSSSSSNAATPDSESIPTVQASGDVLASTKTPDEPDLQDVLLAPEVKSTFQRAADIIREATEVEAALFFDASVGSFAGLVETAEGNEHALSSNEFSDFSSAISGSEDESYAAKVSISSNRRIKSARDEKQCRVLGISLSDELKTNNHTSEKNLIMTETFLKGLLRRHPRGKVFNFDASVTPSRTTSADKDIQTPTSYVSVPNNAFISTSTSTHTKRRAQRARKLSWHSEAVIIHKIFPRARCLALCPLWDSHRERWFAAAIIWTTKPMRIFTNEGELSYLAAFGNSVMAEVARLDAKQADRAKADLLSSISHELRSPLHGVLGSVELLQDTKMDAFQRSIIHTINTCGKTLLDTINHLLDFAKINNLVRESAASESKLSSHRRLKATGDLDSVAALSIGSDDFANLREIMEEVLESVFAGYDFQRHAAQSLHEDKIGSLDRWTVQPPVGTIETEGNPTSSGNETIPIRVILEIDKACSWLFRTNAGAWRRILMNLFGNSLKYTASGFIKVSLRAKPLPSRPGIDASQITLVVSDSGKGISKEYLQNRLFTPFAQEDSRSPGTGLGLSIIRQIVASLGGDIKVQSELGVGTEVTVTCSLTHAALHDEAQSSPADQTLQHLAQEANENQLKVKLVGFDLEPAKAGSESSVAEQLGATMFKKSIERLCSNWFGMEIPSESVGQVDRADIYIATEVGALSMSSLGLENHTNLNGTTQNHKEPEPAPVVIICRGASTAQSAMTSRVFTEMSRVVEYISQPCGPLKLAQALSVCLKRQKSNNGVADKLTVPDIPQLKLDDSSLDRPNPRRQSLLMNNDDLRQPRATTEPAYDQSEDQRTPLHSNPANSQDSGTPLQAREDKGAPLKAPLSVLLVDDNAINLRLLVTYMRKKGYRFETALNGLEALEKYKAAPVPFDWILMDITMPVMDGLTATREIRAFEREMGRKAAQVIALTGLASASAQQEAFTSGVNVFLPKPVRLNELSKILVPPVPRSMST